MLILFRKIFCVLAMLCFASLIMFVGTEHNNLVICIGTPIWFIQIILAFLYFAGLEEQFSGKGE